MNTSKFSMRKSGGFKVLGVFVSLLAIAVSNPLTAATDEEQLQQVEEKELQQQLQKEYEKALKAAEKEQQSAEKSMQTAREQMKLVSEQQRELAQKNAQESQKARAAQQAEMTKMHEELNRARRQLRETSREIARVDRELARARSERHTSSVAYQVVNRPVIGVILGDADDVGVKVLGVSPDGPAERAGITQGDVIVAVGGQVLGSIEESENARDGLQIVMKDVKADEPLTLTYERADKTVDVTVIPEVRKPVSWHTVTRFPTAPNVAAIAGIPAEPGKVISIERIVVPEIDTDEISEQIEKIRVQIDERNIYLNEGGSAPVEREYEFEFHEMSEMGDFALHDANVWFGNSITQGLQLAEVDPDLGEYFKTDRGVLVLKAQEDNDLQLLSGDVILQVGDTEVNSPAEFMRSLREFESGEELEINIKRKRKNQKLELLMPDKRTSFFSSDDADIHAFQFSTHSR